MTIPAQWLPECSPKRIIVHWTAGPYNPTNHDLECYNLLVSGDLKLHRGVHSIADQSGWGDKAYHTYALNTDSIGVSACCMGGPDVSKKNLGKYPLLREQWDVLVGVVAELCKRYRLRPVEQEVLMHGDVHRVYGIDQWGKWDINFLPWLPSMAHDAVGDYFRKLVKDKMSETKAVIVKVNGKVLPEMGVLTNETTLVPLRAIGEALGLKVSWDGPTKTATLEEK